MSFSVPVGAVAGEPDGGDDFEVSEMVLFAADVVGQLKYVLDLKPQFGYGA